MNKDAERFSCFHLISVLSKSKKVQLVIQKQNSIQKILSGIFLSHSCLDEWRRENNGEGKKNLRRLSELIYIYIYILKILYLENKLSFTPEAMKNSCACLQRDRETSGCIMFYLLRAVSHRGDQLFAFDLFKCFYFTLSLN
jgi:hypothetical protein